MKYYPTARVEINSPFFTGVAKALCMDNPLHDVIIGNIEGAKLPSDTDFTNEVNNKYSNKKTPVMKSEVIKTSEEDKEKQVKEELNRLSRI